MTLAYTSHERKRVRSAAFVVTYILLLVMQRFCKTVVLSASIFEGGSSTQILIVMYNEPETHKMRPSKYAYTGAEVLKTKLSKH